MCKLARIAAMMPSTRLRPSSIKGYYQIRFVFAIEQSEPYIGSVKVRLGRIDNGDHYRRLIGTSGILKEAEPDLAGLSSLKPMKPV
jgi:hypothetical protein